MSNNFTYSAKEAEEAKKIRKSFVTGELSDIDRLRDIEKQANKNAIIPAITLGVLSALVFGTGLSLVLLPAGLFALGVVIGVIGIIGMSSSYLLYTRRMKAERAKYEDEVKTIADRIIAGKVE